VQWKHPHYPFFPPTHPPEPSAAWDGCHSCCCCTAQCSLHLAHGGWIHNSSGAVGAQGAQAISQHQVIRGGRQQHVRLAGYGC
jgi:hypothetical protein